MALRIDPELARSPGISYQELLDRDSRAVPHVLRLTSPQFLGSDDIPIERYSSRAWHEAEVERLWKRVWHYQESKIRWLHWKLSEWVQEER